MLAGRFQNAARADGRLDPVSATVQNVLSPLVNTSDNTFDAIEAFTLGITSARTLTEANHDLAQKVGLEKEAVAKVGSLESENARLRALMDLPDFGKQKVFADILAHSPYEDAVTISVGSDKGITPNLAVVTTDGLLGVVSTVSETRSQVILLTSRTVTISALAKTLPLVPGLVRGSTRDTLIMDVLEAQDIPAGTEVVTTGYSEFIPRGIKVGVVAEFLRDDEFGSRRATIVPSARLGLGREVAVLK